jgi:hypothetical protein
MRSSRETHAIIAGKVGPEFASDETESTNSAGRITCATIFMTSREVS